MADYTLLKRLCEIRGISGDEQDVREQILREVAPFAESTRVTPLGNLIVEVRGKQRAKNKLMVSAHMDETGMIVSQIQDDGSLRFICAGPVSRRAAFARHVLVAGKYPGVIGGKPIHLLSSDERGKAPALDEQVIDIGALNKAEAAAVVRPGDSVTFESVFEEANGKIMSRALCDRAGCAILIELIREGMEYDTTFCFTVQEESGRTGAETAAYDVAPDAAVVLDAAAATDVKGAKNSDLCRLGKGPVIPLLDRSAIYDRSCVQAALAAADEQNIPHQTGANVTAGTEAGPVHVSRKGVHCAAVLLPCRYPHGAVSMISCEDYEHTLALLRGLCQKIAGEEL